MYTTKHAQRLFDVRSDQTIRNWIREFQEFFSFDATPGKGVDFQLTEDDMRVLDLIASMRSDRRPADEIYASLKAGQRGKLPEYTPEELNLVVRGDYEKYLSIQMDDMSLKLAQVIKENEELRASIQPVRDENIHVKAKYAVIEKQVDDLRAELEQERTRSQEQLERLLREIAELRYKMGQLEQKQDDKKE